MAPLPRTLRQRLRSLKLHLVGTADLPAWALAGFPDYYAWWLAANEAVTARRRREMRRAISSWEAPPPISLLLVADRAAPRQLGEAVDSVRAQVYPHWELIIGGCRAAERPLLERLARRDRRIRVAALSGDTDAAGACNAALAAAGGSFVCLLRPGDRLSPHALFELASAIRRRPDAGIVYSDEDRALAGGRHAEPRFKPDFNYELLLGWDFINGVGAYRRSLVRDLGGLAPGLEGAEEYDLALRCVERLAPAQVVHVPRVLCHREAAAGTAAAAGRPDSHAAGSRAVQRHLDRVAHGAIVEPHPESALHRRIRFPLPDPAPKVSIVVPTRNAHRLVEVCLGSLLGKTRYDNYEVIVVDNGSDEPALLDYLAALARERKITLLRDGRPFNFAALNNGAVARSGGEYVLLLNNDMEIIEPGWLAEMVSVAARPGIGAVGARLWYPDRTLQHAGVVLGLGAAAGHVFLGLAAGDTGYCGRAVLLQSYSAVTGACLLVRRALYDAVGGLDEENLAVAFNDVDFCLKLLASGYRNVWTPHAQLIHHESASRGSDQTPGRAARFEAEARFMHAKWGDLLRDDPAFNVNLNLSDPAMSPADVRRKRRGDDPG